MSELNTVPTIPVNIEDLIKVICKQIDRNNSASAAFFLGVGLSQRFPDWAVRVWAVYNSVSTERRNAILDDLIEDWKLPE